jgi:hypothetical protein
VRHKHLERRYHLRQRHRLVAEPLLVVGRAVEEDEEIVVGALVVDLGLSGFSADHVGGFALCGDWLVRRGTVVWPDFVAVVLWWWFCRMDGYSLREGRDGVRKGSDWGRGRKRFIKTHLIEFVVVKSSDRWVVVGKLRSLMWLMSQGKLLPWPDGQL